ncbi:carbon-nitrogen hydrolase family protein [bacterium]|nr:carbon-nitrogen hydrolase family protein [bacterium]
MNVTAIQFTPKDNDLKDNLAKIVRLVDKAAKNKPDLILLPEVSDTGYVLKNISELASEYPNESTNTMSSLAQKHSVIIVAGLLEKKEGKIYNNAVIFNRSGKMVAKYSKTHLCDIPPFNETAFVTPGNEIKVFEIEGVVIGLTICFDIRFPEIYRKLTLDGAQLILHQAAFPTIRVATLDAAVKMRAVENQVFVVSANYFGKHGGCKFAGHTQIVAPGGNIIKMAKRKNQIISAKIDLAEVDRHRNAVPVFYRRREDLY